jgi:hypothetical protein
MHTSTQYSFQIDISMVDWGGDFPKILGICDLII